MGAIMMKNNLILYRRRKYREILPRRVLQRPNRLAIAYSVIYVSRRQ